MNPGTSGGGAPVASRASTVSDGFMKADSSNLPHMDECMILEYMASSNKHNVAEIRGAKMLMSSRDSYLESAVGYVELQRIVQQECIVRAKVTPEHKISSKNYIVTVRLQEIENTIIEAVCDGCAAAAGGCKHTLVFLFWLNKRSNEPAPTSIQCYWKKPKLAAVRSEPVEAANVFETVKKIKLMKEDPSVLENFKRESNKNSVKESLISLYLGEKKESYNLFDMTLEYVKTEDDLDFDVYKNELDQKITTEVIDKIKKETMLQVDSKMWHSVRQGRITASTIYAASQCKCDGSLVQQILGGYKVPETRAIKRGRQLEDKVIKVVEAKLKTNIEKCGFILINSLIGASPDGLGEDYIVEVKCPISEKTMKNYVSNNIIKKKYAAQMQLQMAATNKIKGLLCVASPQFERNSEVDMYWLKYDPVFCHTLMQNAINFWKKYIFKKIINSAS